MSPIGHMGRETNGMGRLLGNSDRAKKNPPPMKVLGGLNVHLSTEWASWERGDESLSPTTIGRCWQDGNWWAHVVSFNSPRTMGD